MCSWAVVDLEARSALTAARITAGSAVGTACAAGTIGGVAVTAAAHALVAGTAAALAAAVVLACCDANGWHAVLLGGRRCGTAAPLSTVAPMMTGIAAGACVLTTRVGIVTGAAATAA